MILDPVLERFVQDSPLSVTARATLENVLPAFALEYTVTGRFGCPGASVLLAPMSQERRKSTPLNERAQ